jgi:hypothetical protein
MTMARRHLGPGSSRPAIASALLVAALGCKLDRGGLQGSTDARTASDGGQDRPVEAPASGGATGQGGGGGADDGATGGNAALGDAGDASDASDAADADAVLTCGASPLCDGPHAVTVTLPGGRYTGSTSGPSLDQGSCGGGDGPESVFRLVLTQISDVFVTSHGTGFDTVVYMRSDCCGAEIGCNDDADSRHTSVLSPRALPPGVYDIFIDGARADQMGAFTVDIYATPSSDVASDNCGSAGRIAALAVSGTTCGLADDFSPLVGCLVAPPTTGADAVYYFVLDAPATVVTFSTCTNTCIDTVLFIRDICTVPGSQTACNDDFCRPDSCPAGAGPTQSRVTATLPPGVHYLALDSHLSGPANTCGSFTISSTGVPP